jgi:tRNA A37 threonylcarbamoyladenosine synthetase subunit TsaC/SUA5/YrdC
MPSRPIVTDLGHQYQAPIVTPSPRASGSVSSSDEDHDLAERGTLLPKVGVVLLPRGVTRDVLRLEAFFIS